MLLCAEHWTVFFIQQAFCFRNIRFCHDSFFLQGSADSHHRLILKLTFKELLVHDQTTLEYFPDTQPT